MERPRRSFLKLTLAASAVFALLAFLTHSLWLPVFGYGLLEDEAPAKSDLVVVLGGDYTGNRLLKAAELVRAGYAPTVLVSGPSGFWGAHECDFAIPFAVSQGYPEKWFIRFPHSALSTREEAGLILPELQRRGVHSYLLVTSAHHTARAARTFRDAERKSGSRRTLRVVAAPEQYFQPDSWWRVRESRKIVVQEWAKTIATVFGI